MVEKNKNKSANRTKNTVKVTSFVPLSPSEKKQVAEFLQAKGIVGPEIIYETGRKVLGGIVIQTPSWILDLSLKKNITDLTINVINKL